MRARSMRSVFWIAMLLMISIVGYHIWAINRSELLFELSQDSQFDSTAETYFLYKEVLEIPTLYNPYKKYAKEFVQLHRSEEDELRHYYDEIEQFRNRIGPEGRDLTLEDIIDLLTRVHNSKNATSDEQKRQE